VARASRLKVYRTPIGFHDAYVAASSQKAALEAWGSAHDLFARGIAELVTDPALTAEPLAQPGTVIKRSRGTTAEQIAALPPDVEKKVPAKPAPDAKPAAPRKAEPRPSREALDTAETRLEEAERRFADEAAALAKEAAALERRRRQMEKDQAADLDKLRGVREAEDEKYAAAIRKWRG
jgi:hypothetical protein